MNRKSQRSAEEIRLAVLLFRSSWRLAVAHGLCDAWGGAESMRVLAEWIAAKYPADVKAFIVERASVTTPEARAEYDEWLDIGGEG